MNYLKAQTNYNTYTTLNYPASSHMTLVTIDSETTKDLDDAIAICKNEDGSHLVRVVISNPVPFVTPGSIDDCAAFSLGATVYRRDHATHRMLGARISEEDASLVAGKPRQAIVFDMTLDLDLDVTRFEASAQEITVNHRLSYSQIPDILGDDTHPAHSVLSVACALSQALLAKRRKRGAMALFDLQQLMMTNEDGKLARADSAEEMIGNIIVQEMMILTNSQVAMYMLKEGVPAVFRTHKRQASAPSSVELATTVQSWLDGRAIDSEEVRSQFNQVVGRAYYSGYAAGHYGLNLPVYLHVTSPLRRYADLMNMRQLCAHLAGQSLAYSNAELIEVSVEQLNANIERQRQSRSEGFKASLKRTVERQVAENRLKTLAEHEIEAAIKLSAEAGAMPEPISEEITRRIQSNTLGMSATTRLVFKTPISLLNDNIRKALSEWLDQEPSRAPMLANAGAQIDMIKIETPKVTEKDGIFSASVILTQPDEKQWKGEAQANRKALASQKALVQAVSRMLGVEFTQTVDLTSNSTSSGTGVLGSGNRDAGDGNPKGALIEWCQKAKVSLPEFNHTSEGPSHCPRFSVIATCLVGEQKIEARADEASSKKQAEAIASQVMLEKIAQLEGKGKITVPAASMPAQNDNPVSTLQEWTQKWAAGLPTYDFITLPGHPPEFECTVRIKFEDQIIEGFGRGASKQESKTNAARNATSNIVHAANMMV